MPSSPPLADCTWTCSRPRRTGASVGGFPETARPIREEGCDVQCFDADALCIPVSVGRRV